MAFAVTVALLVFYALLYRQAHADPTGRRVLVFAATAQAAIGVAQLTSLDETAFTLVLVPAIAIAGIWLLVSRRPTPG